MKPEQITRFEITIKGKDPIGVLRSNLVVSGNVQRDYQPRLLAAICKILLDARKHFEEDIVALEVISNRGE